MAKLLVPSPSAMSDQMAAFEEVKKIGLFPARCGSDYEVRRGSGAEAGRVLHGCAGSSSLGGARHARRQVWL
jgi:hypothetical protein